MIFTADDLLGLELSDRRGHMVGRISAFYRYPAQLEAPWGVVAVTRGRAFKKSTHLVDLSDAQIDNGVLVASYPAVTIESAPHYRPAIGSTLEVYHAVEVLNYYRPSPGST